MKKLFIIILLILLMCETVFAWWDSDYGMRQNISIDNTAITDELHNHQLLIDIPYDSDMNTDFSDLRFTWFNSTSEVEKEIDYWLENKTDSNAAWVWIEVPHIRRSGEETVYMYYDNTGASTTSSGDDTFISFNDFETGTENWVKQNAAYYMEQDCQNSHLRSCSLNITRHDTADPVTTVYRSVTFPNSTYYIVDWSIMDGAANEMEFSIHWSGASGYAEGFRGFLRGGGDFRYKLGSSGSVDMGTNWVSYTWYRARIIRRGIGTWDIYYYDIDGTYIDSATGLSYSPNEVFDRLGTSIDGGSSPPYEFGWLDRILVRGYASTVPTYSFLAEESGAIDPCACPALGNWEISGGAICNITDACDIGDNKFRVLANSGVQIYAQIRAGGCYIDKDASRWYLDNSAGLFCGHI